MEPHIEHQIERFERLYSEHRRTGLIYGIAIFIVTLVVTYLYITSSATNKQFLPSQYATGAVPGVMAQPLGGQPAYPSPTIK